MLRSTRSIDEWSGFSAAQVHRLCCEDLLALLVNQNLILILVLMEYGLRVVMANVNAIINDMS